MKISRFLLPALALAASGCAPTSRYQRPQVPIPTTWPSGPAYQRIASTQATAPDQLPWQEFYTDPRLRKVIAAALLNNRDLRLAALNVQRAQGIYGIQRAELIPKIGASASLDRRRFPADLSPGSGSLVSKQYNVSLGVLAWEPDFFGRIRSLSAAALNEYLSTEQAARSARILLVSNVAGTWLTLAADRENLQLAQTTLQSQQDALDLVSSRVRLGGAPELDLYRAQAQVQSAQVAVARFIKLTAQDLNALNLLAGSPAPDELLPASLADAQAPAVVQAGASSQLLLQRPDILQAEYHLRAAYANVEAARAALFPTISLTGSVGTASSELSGLFKSGSQTWNFVPQIALPLLDARIWAAARVSKVDRQMAVENYQRAIQISFREVADALAVVGTVDQQVAAQQALVDAVAKTYRLSNLRYERGLDNYLSVLDAQRSLYAAQQELVLLRLEKMTAQVRLYATLGGGGLVQNFANSSVSSWGQ